MEEGKKKKERERERERSRDDEDGEMREGREKGRMQEAGGEGDFGGEVQRGEGEDAGRSSHFLNFLHIFLNMSV